MSQEQNASKIVAETLTAHSPELNRALRHRLDEFHKLRRDLIGRQTEAGAALEQRLEQCRILTAELEATLASLNKNNTLISKLDSDSWDEPHLQSELGIAMRALENCRLELMARVAKLGEMESKGSSSRPESPASLVPELNSLTFRQLVRIGLAFSLPLIVFVLAGAALVAAAFFLAMRV